MDRGAAVIIPSPSEQVSGVQDSLAPQSSPCAVTAVEFDFANKIDRQVTFESALEAMKSGNFVWIDVDVRDADEARRLMHGLDILAEETIDDALKKEPSTQQARYEHYIHLVL